MAYRRMNQTLIGKLALGAIASTLLLTLASCGGSNSSTPAAVSSSLAAAPSTFSAFGNTSNTVGITGGVGPYRVSSNNPTVLPVPAAVTGATFIFTPNNVASDTTVTLTVTDSAAATSTVTVTVTPATIPARLITVTPAAGSLCAASNNAATSAATFCGGGFGTASVALKDTAGAALANRSVRFEALTTGATFAATTTAAIFSRVYSVNTDAQGVATAVMRADAEAASEVAFIRATDTVSGHRVDTWVTVLKQSNGASALNIVPTTGGMAGYYTSECPFVRREYNVYGGTAPYAITLPANSLLTLANETAAATTGSGLTVAKSGARFTVENSDSLSCVALSSIVTVTDALGATTTATYSVTPGSAGRSTTASADLAVSPPTLTLLSDVLSAYCSSSSARFTVSGGTAPYVASGAIPQIATTLTGGTSITASFASDAKWKLLKGQTSIIYVLDSAGKVAVANLSCV